MWVGQGDLHLRMGRVITVQTFQIKCRCQFVVKLKANKCYQESLRFLFSYINLLNIRFFAQVSGLCVSTTGDVTVTTPRFVLVVSLVILLWLHRSGRIVNCIALIASDHIVVCITLIILTVLLIVLLWFLCSEMFSAFGIVFTIYSSKSERSKT